MKKSLFLLMILGIILFSASMTMAQMYRIKVLATGEYLRLDPSRNELVATTNPPNDASVRFMLVKVPDKQHYRIQASINGKYLRADEQSGKIVSTDNISDDYSKFGFIQNPNNRQQYQIRIIGSGKTLYAEGQGVQMVSNSSKPNLKNIVFSLERFRLNQKYDPANEVTFFSGENYTGEQLASFQIADYPSMGKYDFNDKVSSIKLGSNVAVQICEDDNFNGECEYLFADTPSLNTTSVKNKQVSSYRLLPKEMARRFIKLEETKDDPPSPGYVFCADEGRQCNFGNAGKMVRVAYGSYGRFKYKYFNTDNNRSIQCNTSSFGDPVTKGPNKCFVSALALDPSPTPKPTPTPIRVTPVTPQNTATGTTSVVTATKSNDEPGYVLRNGDKCVEIDGTGRFRTVKLADCNGSSNQKWVFAKTSDSSNYGKVRTLGNKCLSFQSESRGDVVIARNCDDNFTDKWMFTERGELTNRTRCLNANTGGDFIPLTNCSGALNQVWRFEKYGEVAVSKSPESNGSTTLTANKVPVVEPENRGGNLQLQNISLNDASLMYVSNSYSYESNAPIRFGNQESSDRYYRNQKSINRFDFAINQAGDLFSSRSTGNVSSGSNGFVANFRNDNFSRVGISMKLKKIAVTDKELFGINSENKLVSAQIDPASEKVTRLSFRIWEKDNNYSDVATDGDAMWVTNGRVVYKWSFAENKWRKFADEGLVKFISINGIIYGLRADGKFVSVGDGVITRKGTTVVIENVKDFAYDRESSQLYFISSKTNLLMRAKLVYNEVTGITAIDDKGTFTKFLSKDSCVVEHTSGKIYTCN